LLPFVILAAAALFGLFLLARMLLDTGKRKSVRKTESTAAQVPEVAPKQFAPEQVFVQHIEMDGGDAQPNPTESILSARGPDCLPCARRNGCLDPTTSGGTCEQAVGMATGCGPGVTEKDICLKTLHDIFDSKCAESMQETPCLCGTTDTMACLSGTETPTGPAYRDYACDFGTADAVTIQQKFVQADYGVGQANALIQCTGGFDCACFGN
jgi:hypothetical protein